MKNKVSLQEIANGEDKLVEEIKAMLNADNNLPLAEEKHIPIKDVKAVIYDLNNKTKPKARTSNDMPHVEAVILPFMRPVLFVKNNKITIPESNELKGRLLKYKPMIEQVLQSVGRIELKNHNLENIGTGWLIADNIIATNRHVADVFAYKSKKGLGGDFKKNIIGEKIESVIDFNEEYNGANKETKQFEIEIEKVIYLPNEISTAPDLALLKIKTNNNIPNPIPFLNGNIKKDQLIGVVGYPFQDPRGVSDAEMEKRIFSNIFGVKRYAPGQIINVPQNKMYFMHDASTLGGNSGSLVQDMESGCAIGIHFAGRLLDANYAVKGSEILNIASKLKIAVSSYKPKQVKKIHSEPPFVVEKTYTTDEYANRTGYDSKFLGNKQYLVNLPKVKNKTDIVTLTGTKSTILKYTHFSVEMSKSRRLCFYSAVNIEGSELKKIKRTGWRYDSRIPEKYQIMKECYGNKPMFSRGHMTRREDPNWGTIEIAKLGNNDSMHVTNTVPQMQNFNSGIWLTLENYALENAREDAQKISVFTGPFFSDNDPIKFGVKIPVSFWKVIAFIHPETNKLCATGYTMSQEDYLKNDEFIFGEFKTYQIPIKLIEKKAKVSFSKLSNYDPLKDDIHEAILSPIESVRQIRFL